MPHDNICAKCYATKGGCCFDLELAILEEEVNPFRMAFKEGKHPVGHKLTWEVEEQCFIYSTNGEKCMFLQGDNNCGIYHKRPLICRMYPLLWRGKKKLKYYLDKRCDLTQGLSENEFRMWPFQSNNKHMINLMGELDFKAKRNMYKKIKLK